MTLPAKRTRADKNSVVFGGDVEPSSPMRALAEDEQRMPSLEEADCGLRV